MMRLWKCSWYRTISGPLVGILLPVAFALAQSAPNKSDTAQPYILHIPVDEISLRFHAVARNGQPLTQLSVHDLELSDNGKPQNRIVMLESLQNLPIRAGFLFDISASMLKSIEFDQGILQMYVSGLLRKGVDQAFVMQFDTVPLLIQKWTDIDSTIMKGASSVGPRASRDVPFTAIFDSLYIACRDQWGAKQSDSSGNFILLFSDGEDNSSHAYLSEAVDMCQRRHVAIYVIDINRSSHRSDGYKAMNDLANQTGGRVFIRPRRNDIWQDLQIIEAEQRSQYRLVYKPSEFTADGSFHRIQLQCQVPGAQITTRSGYYAFAHP